MHTWWLSLHTDESWAFIDTVFTDEEIQKIIEIGSSLEFSDPGVPKVGKNELDNDKRMSDITWIKSDLESNHWIFQRLTAAVNTINQKFYQYDLQYIEALQFTKYEAPAGWYGKHIDMEYSSPGTRKLSFTVQLTDPESYKGGDLVIDIGTDHKLKREKGTMCAFPSYLLHEVTPVTEGTRYSLVGWVVGPRWK